MLTVLDKVKNESFVFETLKELGSSNLSSQEAFNYVHEFFQDILAQSSAEINSHNISTLAWLISIKLFPDSAYNQFVQQFIKDEKYGEFDNEPSDADSYERFLRAHSFLMNSIVENTLSVEESSNTLIKGAKLLREYISKELVSTKKSKMWMLEELQETHLVIEFLESLSRNEVSIDCAYEQMCNIIKLNLMHFSAKENLRNSVTISSLLRTKLFPYHPLSENTLQWLKEGKYEDFSSEPEFVYAVPRGCSMMLLGAKYSNSEALVQSSEKLQQYIESLGVLPNINEVRE
jgi:hypothetical protein